MHSLTHRERIKRCFAFQEVDVAPFDLMEGTSWPQIDTYFQSRHGLASQEALLNALGCDVRWVFALSPHQAAAPGRDHFSDNKSQGLLQDIDTIHKLDRLFQPDPANRILPDFDRFADHYPHHARVFAPLWMPTFFNFCMDFGMEQALCHLLLEPELVQAYIERHTACTLEVLKRALDHGAARSCDFYWLGDDFASETSLILDPALWRTFFRPALEQQVRLAREAGLTVLFHSCGAVSDVYEDFIDMGIQAHCGVQTSAAGMDIDRLAADFGGRLVIYGGVDAQTTLIQQEPAGVQEEVRRNLAAFDSCGGYIVSNSHHTLPDMPPENIEAMARGAGRWTL